MTAADADDTAKRAAARRACTHVADGMVLGLGTGSTADFMLRRLGERIREEGLRITGVATSNRTAATAREQGIPIVDLDEAGRLDLTIDGADEVDPALRLIKGGGGAHLREKIVAAAADRMIVMADPSKRVDALGAFPLPVEVIGMGWTATRRHIAEVLAGQDVAADEIRLRGTDGAPFVTDEGNRILDLHLGRIGDPAALAAALAILPGVVETGLFIDLGDLVVLGHGDGRVEEIGATSGVST